MVEFHDRKAGRVRQVNTSARGPSFSPPDQDQKRSVYVEGYEHGQSGEKYKGYGGRPAAIAYGAGYKHGQADAPKPSPKSRQALVNHLVNDHRKAGLAASVSPTGKRESLPEGWTTRELHGYHANLHRYGGKDYDSSAGGPNPLTHDHTDQTTRASRGITG